MELRILECLAAFFMFLSIVRPFVRGLWELPGLTVCPLLALAIIVGIFPTYGFRPECIPLLLFAIFLFLANMSDFLALFYGLHSDSYRDRSPFFTLGSAAAFAFVMWITINYAPPMDAELSTIGVKTVFLQDGKLHIRIYGQIEQKETSPVKAATAESASTEIAAEGAASAEAGAVEAIAAEQAPTRPLLIFLPPVAGSFTVSDAVCTALRNRGFTVLSCSRVNFDSPFFDQTGKPVRLYLPGLFRLGNALTRGLSDVGANAGGRELENGRKQDIIFLLQELSANKTLLDLLGNTDKNMIFLAGYGAGGAALTVLAGQDDFISRHPQIRGIAAIEAPLLSSLEGDPLPPPPPPAPDPVSAFYQQITEYTKSLSPRDITHITEIPRPGLPILFIVSDRVINERKGRYETILRSLGASRNAALVAAVPGAGPFDYSGSPTYYPMFSLLFRGSKPPERQYDWPELTAALITNFAALILKNEAAVTVAADTAENSIPPVPIPPKPFHIPLVKTALNNNIYLEQGGVWHIPNMQTILQP